MDDIIIRDNKKEEPGSSNKTISAESVGSVYIPWEQRHRLLLRIIAAVVVVAFIFTQTGIAGAFDRDRINPSQVTKERTGYLGLEAFQEHKKLELQELEQRRKIEQQRTIAPVVALYEFDKTLYANNPKENIYGIYPERFMGQQEVIQEILRIKSMFGKDYTLQANPDGSMMRINFDPFSGLTTSISNERFFDDHGNLMIRDTYDMQYYGNRLLRSYRSKTTAPDGVVTEIYRFDIEWAPGSVWYASDKTNANKYIISYKEEVNVYGQADGSTPVTDEYTHTVAGQQYDEQGNLLEYTEYVTDKDGNAVQTIHITQMQYDEDGNLTSYYEVVTDANGATVREGIVYISEYQQDKNISDTAARVIIESQLVDGRLQTIVEKTLDSHGNVIQTITRTDFTYDENGNLTSFKYEVKDSYEYVIASLDFTVTKIEDSDGGNKRVTATATKTNPNGDSLTYELTDEYNSQLDIVNSKYSIRQVLADTTVRLTEVIKVYDNQGNLISSTDITTYIYPDGSKLVIQTTQETDEEHDNRLISSETIRTYYSKTGKKTSEERSTITKTYDDEHSGALIFARTETIHTTFDANENPIGTPASDIYETTYDALT